jgi:hypothetical protein
MKITYLLSSVLLAVSGVTAAPLDTSVIDREVTLLSITLQDMTKIVNQYRVSPNVNAATQQYNMEQSCRAVTDQYHIAAQKIRAGPSVSLTEFTTLQKRTEPFLQDLQNALAAFTAARNVIVKTGGQARIRSLLVQQEDGSKDWADAVIRKLPLGAYIAPLVVKRGQSLYANAIKSF